MERQLEFTRVIPAPRAEVWKRLTTVEGVTQWFAPQADIELFDEGNFELLMDMSQEEGKQGSEGCTVVEVWAPMRLQHEWNFPPTMPIRDEKTVVTWNLSDEGKRTRVQLVQTGWKEGPVWDQGFSYFKRAWDIVLNRFEQSFTDGPVDWDKA